MENIPPSRWNINITLNLNPYIWLYIIDTHTHTLSLTGANSCADSPGRSWAAAGRRRCVWVSAQTNTHLCGGLNTNQSLFSLSLSETEWVAGYQTISGWISPAASGNFITLEHRTFSLTGTNFILFTGRPRRSKKTNSTRSPPIIFRSIFSLSS